ncbi:MAG TPA: hypothetical protein VN837_08385 [Chloroflexota bacterium]|nr:hypothetical protein [Chloroflexota bacterium]
MPSDYETIRENNIREYGQGTRHLAFLGQLYTDRTHFIFELLQNAEDAGATRVNFTLFPNRLEVRHDGRLFDENDIQGICGVGIGTKGEDLTKIGKFGVGFKSVYAYTTRPEIHSGDEHFQIEHLVRPSGVAAQPVDTNLGTLFIFLLDRDDFDVETAYEEIAERLADLSVRTLLFLRSILEIEWVVEGRASGLYMREGSPQGAARLVQLLGRNSEDENDSLETWLVFERQVKTPDQEAVVYVEAAFLLAWAVNTER